MAGAIRRGVVLSTALVLILSVSSSLLGLLRSGHYPATGTSLARIYAQDAVILVIAVPVLGIGVWSARRGSLRGRFVWLGSLAFMTYTWATYALTIPFNAFFLGYVVLFSLSLFTLVAGVLDLEADSVYDSLHGRLSVPLYSGFLGLAAVGFAALWLAEIVPATLSGTVPAAIEAFGSQAADTYVIDLGVVVPSLALSAVWLWKRRPWGYALSGIILVFATVLAPAITAITVIDIQEGVAMSLPVIAGSVVPPIIGAAFAGTYLYRLGGPGNDPG